MVSYRAPSASQKKTKNCVKDSHCVLGGVGLQKISSSRYVENCFVLIVNELEELIGNFIAKRRCNSKDDKIESSVWNQYQSHAIISIIIYHIIEQVLPAFHFPWHYKGKNLLVKPDGLAQVFYGFKLPSACTFQLSFSVLFMVWKLFMAFLLSASHLLLPWWQL